MNWYSVFYWVTVADRIKQFFDTSSNVFSWFSVIFFIVMIIIHIAYGGEKDGNRVSEGDEPVWKYWLTAIRRLTVWTVVFAMITWCGYIFCPSKKDALIIIAGGAVGNFITSDSSARQIPAELTTLIRDKMKEEIREMNSKELEEQVDTLKDKSKEELIELLKQKKE